MPGKLTYFLSDVHLGAGYIANARQHQLTLVRWLDSIKHNAEQLFLLGDILDYWFEYRHVVPRGYTRFFGKLAELADSGVKITWLTGNHDIWIFDYLPQELGIEVVDGPITREIGGKTFFLDHGDNVGKQDRSYTIMRSIFRNRLCQWLYSGVHPRWTVPFAQAWSKDNRVKRNQQYINNSISVALRRLIDFSEEHSAAHPEVDFYVYGHLHRMVDHTLSTGKQLVVLGDWIEQNSFATFNGNSLIMQKL
ncbi:MAG: UDP-2,3-diacylglucosamine diphosphatase [Muribaculaceae bacterium]